MDLKINFSQTGSDLDFSNNDLVIENSLETAVIISLFTDRVVEREELPSWEPNARGFWADHVSEIQGDKYGSRLWLLAREKQTEEIRERAEEYAKEALDWLIEDGVAKSVAVSAAWVGQGRLGLEITIERPSGENVNYKFKSVWDKYNGV